MTKEEAIKEIYSVFEPAYANYIVIALTEGATVSDKTEPEPCEDCISRQAVLNCGICDGIWCDECSFNDSEDSIDCCLKEKIKELPSVQPKPKTGHWISYNWDDNGISRWGLKCDCCFQKYKYGGETWLNPNYCPHCGAKMESECEE